MPRPGDGGGDPSSSDSTRRPTHYPENAMDLRDVRNPDILSELGEPPRSRRLSDDEMATYVPMRTPRECRPVQIAVQVQMPDNYEFDCECRPQKAATITKWRAMWCRWRETWWGRTLWGGGMALGVLLAPPVVIWASLRFFHPYLLLIASNAGVALGALEVSWWHFRIRTRVLVSFKMADDGLVTAEAYEQAEHDQMNSQSTAVSFLAQRLCCGSNHVASAVLSFVLCLPVVTVIFLLKGTVISHEASVSMWQELLVAGIYAALLGFFCACYSPSVRDGVVTLTYMVCFAVSSQNSFFMQHRHDKDAPDVLDTLYLLLVSSCAIILWRIVSSKEVLESLLMVVLDIFSLVYFVAPSMAMVDLFSHELVRNHPVLVSSFFFGIAAAEGGAKLYQACKKRIPQCQNPVIKVVDESLDVGCVLCALVCGGIAYIAIEQGFRNSWGTWADAGILGLGILVARLGNVILVMFKEMARVRPHHAVTRRNWVPHVIDSINPFLLSIIVFQPYIRSLIKSWS